MRKKAQQGVGCERQVVLESCLKNKRGVLYSRRTREIVNEKVSVHGHVPVGERCININLSLRPMREGFLILLRKARRNGRQSLYLKNGCEVIRKFHCDALGFVDLPLD